VAYAVGPNRVRVRRADGEVQFTQDDGPGGAITYSLIRGQDPLGWHGAVPEEMLAGAACSPREWLAATAATGYPDLPAQIVAYFRAARGGDLAVFAAVGWDFGAVNRAGHGGLRPGDMHVPLLLAGPGVPHQRRRAARTVDLMPTLLALLGRPIPPGLDGRCLVALPTVPGAALTEEASGRPAERAEGP
jgi:arylsulfatase A-like enzyme